MKRTHALVIVLAVAVAAVAGTFAALRTAQLRTTATPKVTAAQIASQNRALDRAQAALNAQLRRQPPALPPLPRVGTPIGSGAAAPAPAGRVVYVRPKPLVRVIHRSGGETGDDHELSQQSSNIGSTFDD
ncbi:MAG TPA: hypothetical protein VNC40_04935 [Gaiellaceae bacterium]|nr:hypothetical protein [Gaiellaceae bacterium]